VGFLISFVTAIFAVKGFIALLGKMTLKPFAWYRLVVGFVVIAMSL